jgi:hypothetical protein
VQAPPSINQLIYKINNEKDFDDFILKHATKAPLAKSELNYVKHPTQASAQSHPTPPHATGGVRRASLQMQSQPPPSFTLPQPEAHAPTAFNPEPVSQAIYPGFQQPPQQQIPQAQAPPHSNPPYSPGAQNPYSQPDYPRGPAGQATAQQSSGVLYNNNSQPPVNPVFGLTLEDLFRRDGSPVPMVVYQCIQAVDLFGLEVEGIYRIPGTSSHIQQMKALFDSGMYRSQVYLDRANIDRIQMLHRSISEIQRLSNMTSIALPGC